MSDAAESQRLKIPPVLRWAEERPRTLWATLILVPSFVLAVSFIVYVNSNCSGSDCLSKVCRWDAGDYQSGDLPIGKPGEPDRRWCSPFYAYYAIVIGFWTAVLAASLTLPAGVAVTKLRALARRAKDCKRYRTHCRPRKIGLIHRWAVERPCTLGAVTILTASLAVALTFLWHVSGGCCGIDCVHEFCRWNRDAYQFGDIPIKLPGETEWRLCSPYYGYYTVLIASWTIIFAVLFSPLWGMIIMVLCALALRAKERRRKAPKPPDTDQPETEDAPDPSLGP